jgi:hypothetical protein
MTQRTTRIRRGKIVEIPEEWRGKVTDRQTIRKRPSKTTRKVRNAMMRHWRSGGWVDGRKRAEARAPRAEEWEWTHEATEMEQRTATAFGAPDS